MRCLLTCEMIFYIPVQIYLFFRSFDSELFLFYRKRVKQNWNYASLILLRAVKLIHVVWFHKMHGNRHLACVYMWATLKSSHVKLHVKLPSKRHFVNQFLRIITIFALWLLWDWFFVELATKIFTKILALNW